MKRVAVLALAGAALAACGGGEKPIAKDAKAPAATADVAPSKLVVGDTGISFSSAADDYYSFVEYGPKGTGGPIPGTPNGEPVSHTQQTYGVGVSPYWWATEVTVAIIPRKAHTYGCGAGECMQVIFSGSLHNDANHPCLIGTVYISTSASSIIGTSARQVIDGITAWYYPGAQYPGYFGLDNQNSGAQLLYTSSSGDNVSSGTLAFSNGAAASIRQIFIVFPDGGPYPRPATAKIWVSVEDPTGTYVYNEYSLGTINPG